MNEIRGFFGVIMLKDAPDFYCDQKVSLMA